MEKITDAYNQIISVQNNLILVIETLKACIVQVGRALDDLEKHARKGERR
jgi:hypothetical protein